MEESALQESLDKYNQQLLQVQVVLSSSGEHEQQELLKLRDDLIELVQITEESLLSLKKSKLLQLLDDQTHSQVGDEVVSSKDETTSELSVEARSVVSDEEEDEDEIVGTKCRVLHSHDWGGTQQHNAVVLGVESVEDIGSTEDIKVRVLFTNPTHKSMVPCPYFLEGKCAFEESNCRYSHGYIVRVADLKPFREPDFSKVEVDQQCLAKYEDGVWYKSTIRSIDHSNHTFVIHYETYNSDATLELDCILPLDDQDFESVSDDDDDDDVSSLSSVSEPGKLIGGDGGEDDDTLRMAWKPMGGPLTLGDWEQHTRGIGSKLMAKMGYIFGKGLGKDGGGRVEPVEIEILPAGKSLDRIAELREQNKLVEPFKNKKKRKSKAKSSSSVLHKEGSKSDIFNFINTKLGGKKAGVHSMQVPQSGAHADNFTLSDKTAKSSKRKSDKDTDWNLQLFKLHEEMTKVKKHLQRQQDALSRNLGRDSTAAVQIQQKIKGIKSHLSQLEAKEKMVQQKLHHKNQHKKLTVF